MLTFNPRQLASARPESSYFLIRTPTLLLLLPLWNIMRFQIYRQRIVNFNVFIIFIVKINVCATRLFFVGKAPAGAREAPGAQIQGLSWAPETPGTQIQRPSWGPWGFWGPYSGPQPRGHWGPDLMECGQWKFVFFCWWYSLIQFKRAFPSGILWYFSNITNTNLSHFVSRGLMKMSFVNFLWLSVLMFSHMQMQFFY